ncbi:MAG: PEP-CTERM sorting domain-containing protein [Planctomycetales bacterium]|nr:PEP-CTERM sorting domain-containing protein [Planctomycetales bacterium]MCA9167241.1 PEP-CTERM sorting domain-containing protein [Planctomycetales bacterium]
MYLQKRTERCHLVNCNRAIAKCIKILLLIVCLLTCSHANSRASEYVAIDVPVDDQTIFTLDINSLSADGNTGLAKFNPGVTFPSSGMLIYRYGEEVELVSAPNGYSSLTPRNVSGDGSRIVGSMTREGDGTADGYLWSRDNGFQVLSPPDGGGNHFARLISSDGLTILGETVQEHYWKWTEADGFYELPIDYQIVGSMSDTTPNSSSILFSNAVYHMDGRIEFVPGIEDGLRWRLRSISADGRYASGLLDLDGPYFPGLDGPPPATYTVSEHEWEAVRWEVGTNNFELLGNLSESRSGYDRSHARAMSADGQVIVGYAGSTGTCSGGHWDAVVWDERHGMRDLPQVLQEEYGLTVGSPSTLGPRLGVASGISDDKLTVFGHLRELECGTSQLWYARLDWPLGTIRGDLGWDGDLDVADLDKLLGFVRSGEFDSQSDFNFDKVVDQADLAFWVHDLKQTYFGDANLDGEFSSSDLVAVFEAGQYEDSVPLNSTWATGDWNGDGDFTSSDLVSAFADGGYEQGPRAAAQAVPEPATATLLLSSLAGAMSLIRRRKVMR